ncbi:hypothetical protein KOW79_004255 [Hemibagrus wyckioides]|uniref:Uncharacterized protein n=1 Tax=Hemibagrus wyckioides TaxID=337641 RepID=A0A9D3SPJ1_9TELE|nr:hypothetical protein KOW79_004255 [Hemibagrus wyckioides]
MLNSPDRLNPFDDELCGCRCGGGARLQLRLKFRDENEDSPVQACCPSQSHCVEDKLEISRCCEGSGGETFLKESS